MSEPTRLSDAAEMIRADDNSMVPESVREEAARNFSDWYHDQNLSSRASAIRTISEQDVMDHVRYAMGTTWMDIPRNRQLVFRHWQDLSNRIARWNNIRRPILIELRAAIANLMEEDINGRVRQPTLSEIESENTTRPRPVTVVRIELSDGTVINGNFPATEDTYGNYAIRFHGMDMIPLPKEHDPNHLEPRRQIVMDLTEPKSLGILAV